MRKIIWQQGIVTAEDLSGRRPFLLRFHESEDQIPGPVRSMCVIAEVNGLGAEIKGWGGRQGPSRMDGRFIEEFCREAGFPSAEWVRYKANRDSYKMQLY